MNQPHAARAHRGTDNWTAADGQAPPVFWPTLTAEQAAEEWHALRAWVGGLSARFPHTLRLPSCWWRHNDLVELLSALRDYERASFAPNAAATAAVDWHRAYREIEVRVDMWIKRLACSVPGREHPSDDDAWGVFLEADLAARRASEQTTEV